MVTPGIVAGEREQIRSDSDSGNWFIVDIGMRLTGASCGVWYGHGTLKTVTFEKLKELVIEQAGLFPEPPLNLLIEAPLSVVWKRGRNREQGGNPGHRACDSYPGWKDRHWHYNAGASTLVAAQFLLQTLFESQTRQRVVRLFEGHVSFKTDKEKSLAKKKRAQSHKGDALALKHAVWYGTRRDIFCQDEIKDHDCNLILESPFHFFDKTLVPPVIRVNPIG